MKTKISSINELVGMFVDGKKPRALTATQLQDIATGLGYRIAQVRDNHSVYDCMFDPNRLQVHINEHSQITSVRAG